MASTDDERPYKQRPYQNATLVIDDMEFRAFEDGGGEGAEENIQEFGLPDIRMACILNGPDVPVVENLNTKTLALIEGNPASFTMAHWHGFVDPWDPECDVRCGTSHCRAGWAIALAGKLGEELEYAFGPLTAGMLIFAKSCPRETKLPDFFCTEEDAIQQIREAAAREQETP